MFKTHERPLSASPSCDLHNIDSSLSFRITSQARNLSALNSIFISNPSRQQCKTRATARIRCWAMKLRSLHMLPRCFQTIGDDAGSAHRFPYRGAGSPGDAPTKPSTSVPVIRLIQSDGRVKLFHRPVNASELMQECPKHLVCRSDAFCIGQMVPALPEHEQLQPGHCYLLLPAHFFRSVLSFVTIAKATAAAAGQAISTLSVVKTFDVHRTPSGALQLRVSKEFMERVGLEEDDDADRFWSAKLCTTAALEKEYKQLMRFRERQWKPKLESIKECPDKTKRLKTLGSFKRYNRKAISI